MVTSPQEKQPENPYRIDADRPRSRRWGGPRLFQVVAGEAFSFDAYPSQKDRESVERAKCQNGIQPHFRGTAFHTKSRNEIRSNFIMAAEFSLVKSRLNSRFLDVNPLNWAT